MTLLRKFFDDGFIVRALEDNEILDKDENIILLTNKVFEKFPADNQYIISDFLTLNEFLAFTKWLKERTATKLDYQ